jgi:hypothetical protein
MVGMTLDLTGVGRMSEDGQHFITGPVQPLRDVRYLDLDGTLDLTEPARRRYEHSKLYFAWNHRHDFSEQQVICFRIPMLRERQIVRIKLPENLRYCGNVKFRIDPAPELEGQFEMHGVRLVEADGEVELTRTAELESLKQRTREEVEASEAMQRAECPHLSALAEPGADGAMQSDVHTLQFPWNPGVARAAQRDARDARGAIREVRRGSLSAPDIDSAGRARRADGDHGEAVAVIH